MKTNCTQNSRERKCKRLYRHNTIAKINLNEVRADFAGARTCQIWYTVSGLQKNAWSLTLTYLEA